jgi:hypothetical protein
MEFVLGDATYDSEKVRQTAEQAGILFISPINCCNSEERKDAYLWPGSSCLFENEVWSMAVWTSS